MQSPGDVIAEQGEGAVAEQGSTADRQLWAADSLGSRAGGSSFPLPGTSVQEREESRGRRVCDPVDCGLPGFSVREGGSPGRNTGAYWPILVAIPFWSTIFPAALASNPLEYLMLPEPL